MSTFGEFVNKKARVAKKRLGLVEKVLVREKFIVRTHIDDTEEPYLYVASPNSRLTFGGLRIYVTGESIAYRIQKDDKTHPYGKAYRLDIEEMYDDLMSEEDMTEKDAAIEVVEAVGKEINKFFQESLKAEKEIRHSEFDAIGDPLGRVAVRSSTMDYGSLVNNNK
jgi:hypothetical protein